MINIGDKIKVILNNGDKINKKARVNYVKDNLMVCELEGSKKEIVVFIEGSDFDVWEVVK